MMANSVALKSYSFVTGGVSDAAIGISIASQPPGRGLGGPADALRHLCRPAQYALILRPWSVSGSHVRGPDEQSDIQLAVAKGLWLRNFKLGSSTWRWVPSGCRSGLPPGVNPLLTLLLSSDGGQGGIVRWSILMRRMSAHAPITHASRRRVARFLVGSLLRDVERDLVLETLATTAGNRTKSARLLGVSIRTLRNKISTYAADGVEIPRHATQTAP
jgi:hypothetical protein